MFDLLGLAERGRIINNLWFSHSPLLQPRDLCFSSHIVLCLIFFLAFSSIIERDIVSASQKCSGPWMRANTARKLQYLRTVAWETERLQSHNIELARARDLRSAETFFRTFLRLLRNSCDAQEIHKAPWSIKIIWKCACNTKCYFHYALYMCSDWWMNWSLFIFSSKKNRTLSMRWKL